MASRDSISSLSDLGWFGSNRSKNVTSPIDILYHKVRFVNIRHLSIPGIFGILAHRARDVGMVQGISIYRRINLANAL
jgi:hypothetical protein